MIGSNLRFIVGVCTFVVTHTMAISGAANAATTALEGRVVAGPSIVDLTTSGTSDWVNWGMATESSVNRKAGVAAKIGSVTFLHGVPRRFADDPGWSKFRWTDGAPIRSRKKFSGGIYFPGKASSGYQLTVRATTAVQTLRLYVGGYGSNSRLEATLSDGSTVPFVANFGGTGVYSRTVTLTFRARTDGQTLTVRHVKVGKGANIGLQAATLSGSRPDPVDNPPPVINPPVVAQQIFPPNSYWNTRIDRAPLHPRSDDLMANWMHAPGRPIHPDFGNDYAGHYWGMKVNIVGNSTPRRVVTYHNPNYSSESDPMPPEGLPIPDDVFIEGDPRPWESATADHHMILWDTDNQILHELYSIRVVAPGVYTTGQYSRWDTTSNALRPNGWTSADVAGLPIAPLLIRYDEAASGQINHAIRFTLDLSWGQVWPARHPGTSGGQSHPPMGTRVRLRADYPINAEHWPIYEKNAQGDMVQTGWYQARVSPINRAILKCMQQYGMILADHAGDWFVQSEHDPRWDDDDINWLKLVPASLFEVIDGDALIVHPDSGEARQ